MAYRINGEETRDFPTNANLMDVIEPVYETVPGWMSETSSLKSYDDLPEAAQAYVKKIEDFLGIPAAMVSVGPEREATFNRISVWDAVRS